MRKRLDPYSLARWCTSSVGSIGFSEAASWFSVITDSRKRFAERAPKHLFRCSIAKCIIWLIES